MSMDNLWLTGGAPSWMPSLMVLRDNLAQKLDLRACDRLTLQCVDDGGGGAACVRACIAVPSLIGAATNNTRRRIPALLGEIFSSGGGFLWKPCALCRSYVEKLNH